MAIVMSSDVSVVSLLSIIYKALPSSFLSKSPSVSVLTEVRASADKPKAPSPSRSASAALLPNNDSLLFID